MAFWNEFVIRNETAISGLKWIKRVFLQYESYDKL